MSKGGGGKGAKWAGATGGGSGLIWGKAESRAPAKSREGKGGKAGLRAGNARWGDKRMARVAAVGVESLQGGSKGGGV